MKPFFCPKKALSILCVLAFMALLIPLATLPAQAAQNVNVGECYQVDPQNPIVIDGKMDEAYAYGVSAFIALPLSIYTERSTYGVAYFTWSERSIYCYVIVNDDDIVARGAEHWQADCVELYLHRGDDTARDYPATQNSYLNGQFMPSVPSGTHVGRQSGRQYRIDGFNGEPSCYLFGEDLTYTWSERNGRFYHPYGAMVTDDLNAFGWYEGGFAHHTFEGGSSGYAVEYKIDFETPLQPGEKFRFDLMISDRYGDLYSIQQENIYYDSEYRLCGGGMISNIKYYDHFTLSADTAYNDGIIDDEDLYEYGRYEDFEWPDDPEWPDYPEWPDDPEDYLDFDVVENGIYYRDNCVVYCDPEVTSAILRADTVGIASGAFAGCVYLQEVTIPRGVTSIGDGAFAMCVPLSKVNFEADSQLKSIGMDAFLGCIVLQEIVIPEGVTEIGENAFAGCVFLEKVVFDENSQLQIIGAGAFCECLSLSEFVIPSSVASISPEAFVNSSLEHIYYVGTEEAWMALTNGDIPTAATIHFSVCYYGHDTVTHEAKTPTCVEIGWDAYESCLRCDYSTYKEKSTVDHEWDDGEVTVWQTCTTPWIVTYSCKNCTEKNIKTLNNGERLPHSYMMEIPDAKYLKSAATATERAVYYKSCICGAKGEETFTHGKSLNEESAANKGGFGCRGSLCGSWTVLLGLGVATLVKTRGKKGK